MTFEEALTRARASHVVVETWRQPGNDYRTEYVCKQKCGAFGSVFAEDWEQHIIDAADALVVADPPRDPRRRPDDPDECQEC